MGNPECQDWVRLEVLILRRACAILRKIFRKRWKLSQKTDWLDCGQFGKEFISGLGLNVYQTAGRLQKLTLEEGNVNNWDFNTLAKILQTIDFGGLDNEKEENKRIQELITARNKASVYPRKSMGDEEFSGYWDSIEHILVSFGESEKELEVLKLSPSISEDDLMSDSEEPKNEDNIREARKLKEEAKNMVNMNDLDNAITSLSSAISLPGVPDIDLGALYASRSDVYLKRSSKQSEDKTELIYLALKDAKKALSLRPMWGLAHYRVGTAYVELNKLKKACKYLDQALELEPSMEEIQRARKNCRVKIVGLEGDENFDPASVTFGSLEGVKPGGNHGGTALSPAVRLCMNSLFSGESDDNPLAFVWRAHQLRDGRDVKQNYKQAAILYRKGIKSRNAEGMYNLAVLKLQGKGVRQDYPGAIKLLKLAASQPHKLCNGTICVSNVGVGEAEFLLGYLSNEGIGYPQKDKFVAAVWYLSASEHGNGPAANNLAVLHFKGLGVMRDERRALQLWKLAASRKVSHAMHALAIHHLKEWDTSEARKWLQQAIRTAEAEAVLEGNCAADADLLTLHEIEEFEKYVRQLESWRDSFHQKEICRWEVKHRLCGKNLGMKDRVLRMLYDVDQEKIKSLENFLATLSPKPVTIHLDNVVKSKSASPSPSSSPIPAIQLNGNGDPRMYQNGYTNGTT